jgi:predicted RecB family nuclease
MGPITLDIVAANYHCPRKAFLMLCDDETGEVQDHVRVFQKARAENQQRYIEKLEERHEDMQPYSDDLLKSSHAYLLDATLKWEGMEAYCPLLIRSRDATTTCYEPIIFGDTYTLSGVQKIELQFIGYLLGKIQKSIPMKGTVVDLLGNPHHIGIRDENTEVLLPLLQPLQEWMRSETPDPAPLILNRHCASCPFQKLCREKAEKEDHISLLNGISDKKSVDKYAKKGIFTVTQMSHLFRPRRRRKKIRTPVVTHKLELQALAIRTQKIYLQELPTIQRNTVEFFLDAEGVPDLDQYYLMGVLVCDGQRSDYRSFWCDGESDERKKWNECVSLLREHPNAPIYHYAKYEKVMLKNLGIKYDMDLTDLSKRLVNINSFVYGKVYFPAYSNSLKDIAKFLGSSWTSTLASGLQSLAWRHEWDRTHDQTVKEQLLRYNEEDCRVLKTLTDELTTIAKEATSRSNVDFADHPKQSGTERGAMLQSNFKKICRFAYMNYDKNKLMFAKNKDDGQPKKRGGKKGRTTHIRIVPKARTTVSVSRRRTCPKCGGKLKSSKSVAEKIIIDLAFMQNGIRKTVTKYVGFRGRCVSCNEYYTPQGILRFGPHGLALLGPKLQAWIVYQRLWLRLPYGTIVQAFEEQFHEKIANTTAMNFMRHCAERYASTEKKLIRLISSSPFVHVDETQINVEGTNWYVWVFTDGKHVVFRLTETRESNIVHEFLSGYQGALISDFYAGYDAAECEQQKCWAHLIRDLNNDLFGSPFDTEFEEFVSKVGDLILPIFEAVEKYGLKKFHLKKFMKEVNRFYEQVIDERRYKSDLTQKYQKRFLRYRESLFVFLQKDGIPWNNNMAERAIRCLAIQRKISGTFSSTRTPEYLLMLGIAQSCRFQEKSLLQFLVSGEKDIDAFKGRKMIKNTRAVMPKKKDESISIEASLDQVEVS